MKKTVLTLALAAMAVLTVGTIVAQDRDHTPDPKMIAAHKDLVASLKTFARSEILPQLTTWKSQLDGAMSAEDLKTLNDLRARANALQTKMMEYGRAMREAWKSEDYTALKANRENMKKLGADRQAIFMELKPLAEKYRSTLEAIGQDAKPKVESWKQQGKAIFEKWLADHKDQLGDMKEMHHGMMGGFGDMMGHGDKRMMAAHFMLWDGSDFIDKIEQQMQQGGGEFDLK